MRKAILCYVLVLGANCVMAQASVVGVNTINNNKPNSFFTEIKPPPVEIKGDTYYYNWWLPGTVELVNGEVLKEQTIRYDMNASQLEVRVGSTVKGIQEKNINWFSVVGLTSGQDEVFVNAKKFTLGGAAISGFLRRFNEGDWMLLSRTEVVLAEGAYVAALDMGTRQKEYQKKTKLYVARDYKLYEVINNKKKFAAQFNGEKDRILSFIEKNRISLKDEGELLQVMAYLNQGASSSR